MVYSLKKDEAVACLKEILIKCQFSPNSFTISEPENNIILKVNLDEKSLKEVKKIVQKYGLTMIRGDGQYLFFKPKKEQTKKSTYLKNYQE